MVIEDWSLGNLGLPKKLSSPWSKTMAQPISILSMVFELLVAVTNHSAAVLYRNENGVLVTGNEFSLPVTIT